MRVLVTDAESRQALALVRHLGARHQVLVAAPARTAMALHSRYASDRLLSPSPDQPELFLEWLDRIVASERPDLIVPLDPRTCLLLAGHAERWGPGLSVVLPPLETMRLALDRPAVFELAERIGLPVPLTLRPPTLDSLDASGRAVGFPLVILAARENLKAAAFVGRPEDLRATYMNYLERYRLILPELPLLQQSIAGTSYGVFATYQNGQCRRIMAHRRLRESPTLGGTSGCCETFHDAVLLEQGRRLLDALGWHGVAMVEFRRHEPEGRYYLTGLHPHFWGSLDLALWAGADFPGDVMAIARQETLQALEHQAQGLRYCWPLGPDLDHLVRQPRTWRRHLRDWSDPSVRKNLRLGDPLPHCFEMLQTALRLIP